MHWWYCDDEDDGDDYESDDDPNACMFSPRMIQFACKLWVGRYLHIPMKPPLALSLYPHHHHHHHCLTLFFSCIINIRTGKHYLKVVFSNTILFSRVCLLSCQLLFQLGNWTNERSEQKVKWSLITTARNAAIVLRIVLYLGMQLLCRKYIYDIAGGVCESVESKR